MKPLLILSLAAVLSAAPAEYDVYRTSSPPVIDGDLSDWDSAYYIDTLIDPEDFDNLRVNPGSQTAIFYVGSGGGTYLNPYNTLFVLDSNLYAAVDPLGNDTLPVYEIAISRNLKYRILEPFRPCGRDLHPAGECG